MTVVEGRTGDDESPPAEGPDVLDGSRAEDEPDVGSDASAVSWYRRVDRCAAAFVVLATLFGVAFTLVTPPLWGPDETTHVSRAWAVSEGHIAPQQIPDPRGPSFGGEIPASVGELGALVGRQLAQLPTFAPQVTERAQMDALAARPLDGPREVAGFVNTSTYSPVPYAPTVVGLAIARATDSSVSNAVTLMRLANLAFYVVVVGAALVSLRRYRIRWAVLVVALLPMGLFEASMVSVDGTTMALAIALGALVIKAGFLRRRLSAPETAALVAVAIVLPLCKSAYALLPLLLLVVPPAVVALGRAGRWALVGGVGVGLAGFVAWSSVAVRTSSAQSFMGPPSKWGTVNPSGQLHYILAHPGGFSRVVLRTFIYTDNAYFSQFLGTLGWNFVTIPALAMVAIIVATVLAAGHSERLPASRLTTGVAAGLLVAAAAGVFLALYMGFDPVGHYLITGVQGRYFLPLAVLALAVVLRLVPLRWSIPTPVSGRRIPPAVVGLTGLALFLSALKYWYVLWY